MRSSSIRPLLCIASLLLVAGSGHATPVANDGAAQRRAELREALQRRPPLPADSATVPRSERQLTPEERAELRRQLRAQQKSP